MVTTMLGLQFDALFCEEGRRWELLAGDLIEVSSPTPRHHEIVVRLLRSLRQYLEADHSSAAAYADVEFALTDRDPLRPGISVLLADKAAKLEPDHIPIPGAPDIAIKVISPNERATEIHEKMRTYLRSGTIEVWRLIPKSQTVQLHRAKNSTLLEATQKFNSALLPGFTVLVATFSKSSALRLLAPVVNWLS